MNKHGLTLDDADRLLDTIVVFPQINAVFERLRPITDFRKDDSEARVLYICRRLRSETDSVGHSEVTSDGESLYVLKCKIQAPSVLAGGLRTPIPGPSENTKDELKALQTFAETKTPCLPHLVAWKTAVQGPKGLMPEGYVAYIVMTLLPGQHLMDLKFWSMTISEQEEIRRAFIPVIKQVWLLGLEPFDCALRNILWQSETRSLSLVDFEHWYPATKHPINMDERAEMQRWGIVQRPPPASHWEEWFYSEGLTRQQ